MLLCLKMHHQILCTSWECSTKYDQVPSLIPNTKRKQNKAYYIKKYVPTRELLFQLRRRWRWWINMKNSTSHISYSKKETYNMNKNLHTKGIEQTMNKKNTLLFSFAFYLEQKIYIRKRISSIRIFGISWQCKRSKCKRKSMKWTFK